MATKTTRRPPSSTDAPSARATSHLPRITSEQAATLVDLFASEIEAQKEGRADLEEKWDRWDRCYKAEPKVARKEYPWPNASNLVVGLAPIYVDSVAARIMQGIFGVEPHWTVQEINKQWADAANPYERYLEWQREHTWNQYKVVKCFVLDALKLGTGVIHTPWVDRPLYRFDQQTGKMIADGRLTGPQPVWVPRRQFLIPDGYSDPQTAPWIAMQQIFNRQEMRQADHLGQIEHFDKIESICDDEDFDTTARDGNPPTAPVGDELSPVKPWQVWCNHDLDNDGYAEPLILLIHPGAKALLRILPNPYPNGKRMFVHAPFIEQEGKFDGIPITEMVEQYDDEVSTIHNQRRDNSHLANTSMIVARKGSGINKSEKIFPARVFLVNGDPKSEMVEFGIGRSNLTITVQEEQLTTGYAERRVGLSDVNLGQMSSPLGRAAATTMMSVLQEGTRRHDLATSEIRRALTEHGLQITELYKAHGLPAADQPESPEQILDEADAALVRKLFTATDPIRGMIALQLNVATAALNRETEKQSSLQLLGVVTQYFQGVIQMWPQIGPVIMNPQTPPPLKQAILSMVGGVDRAMKGVLQAHQRYDLEGILIADMLGELAAAPPQGPQPMQPGGDNGQGLPGGLADLTAAGQGPNRGGASPFPVSDGGNGRPAGA